MKNSNIKKVILIIIILTIIIVPFVIVGRTIKNPVKVDGNVIINVEEGDSFYGVLNKLSKREEIRGLPIIKLYLKITNKNLEVKPGTYEIHNKMTVNNIVETLTSEYTKNLIKFTVPEGYTVDDIASKLEKEKICTKGDFIKAVKQYNLPPFIKNNDNKKYNLEGYLFPDTYIIKKDEKPGEIVQVMVSRFEEAFEEALKETNIKTSDEDVETVITIASMIEKEARVDKERPIIASVIANRVSEGMNLQIDATVIYALGEHVEKVLYSHLETESPYNTYKINGLPIGPISNPGMPSILAALKPATTDYLFYVLEKDMKHHFFTRDENEFMSKLKELGYLEE